MAVRGSVLASLFVGGLATLLPMQSQARWDIVTTVATEETFTDNANSSTTNRATDFINTTDAGISLQGEGGRSSANFSYSLSRDTYLRNKELNGFRHELLGLGEVDIIPDYVSVDGRASVSEQFVSQTGTTTATDRTTSTNRTRILNYSIAPTFKHGNDGWADSVMTYRLNGNRFMATGTDTGTGDGGLNNTITHEIISGLESGRRFSVLTWSGEARTEVSMKQGQFDYRRDVTEGEAAYVVMPQLTLLASAGYEKFKDKNSADQSANNGLFWNGGMQIAPGPKTNVTIQYGKRFTTTQFSGDLTYRFSPRTTLQGSYSTDFSTQQTALSSSLNNLTTNDDGDIIDATTGLVVDPNDLQTDLVESSFKSQTLSLGLTGTRGRNRFNAGVNLTKRTFSGTNAGSDSSLSLNGSWNRELSRQTTLNVNANFSRSSSSSSGTTKSMNGTAQLSYALNDTLDASAQVSRLYQNTTGTPALKENTVSVSLRKEF
ncbi:TIGR03016 family PEP-CTERM system-associated outer membrane protein [Magnetospira sp. QH-2]|uniref:TIGR03016 family PEP-CTERM system-associated outer membrane protein n=1 Tax=Magnetospira sp. (strain QH-2) TaxID=1288970 RepID=UPI0005FA2317|nr:TIGR03016 family PEP-CTERM system-associated outer membrane protein [Magnetospira sp. QH-2]